MDKDSDQYSEAETERRFKGTLKRMLNTPHQPHEIATGKKHKAKSAKSPRRRSAPKSGAK